MVSESSYRRDRLAPRCLLITSWSWSRFQGFGCSPTKVVHELGSERRETVWSLSAVNSENLRRLNSSTRGSNLANLWWTNCLVHKHSWVAKFVKDNYWMHLSKKLSSKQDFQYSLKNFNVREHYIIGLGYIRL